MANRTSLLQQCLEAIWYDNGTINTLGRCLLMPLSYLYSVINRYQRKTQTKDQIKLSCPVIVVGNITVGGTGKTPLTVHIVNLLKKSGYKPAIITRGYGGKATTWPQNVNANSDASLVGDEAVLMAQRTHVPVYAGADRLESIKQLLEKHECDVIVSDDGMQHYKLPRDIQIAVIDAQRHLGNGYCLPAGPLREKKERLEHCDFIVLNGKNTDNIQHKNQSTKMPLTKVPLYQPDIMYEMTLFGETLVNIFSNEEKQLSDLAGDEVQALTGIGNPQRFYTSLKENKIKVIENSFPDHHDFQEKDLSFEKTATVLMTEKDAVKCKLLIGESKQYWYLPVSANLSEDFDKTIVDKLRQVNLNYQKT